MQLLPRMTMKIDHNEIYPYLQCIIQYCSYMKLMSFCCLTNIYWSNCKMTPISYDYIVEYMTKREHYLTWYDVAINRTIKTCILLNKF